MRPGQGPTRPPDATRRAELLARVTASRAAQELLPYVTDDATLDKIADPLEVLLGRPANGKKSADAQIRKN